MRGGYRGVVLGFVLIAGSLTALTAQSAEVNWPNDLEAAWQTAVKQDRPLLVFLDMDNCAFCQKMQTQTLTDPHVAALVHGAFVPVALHRKQAAGLIQRLQVRAFPTTVIISPHSRLVDRIDGFLAPNEFQRRLHTALTSPQISRRR